MQIRVEGEWEEISSESLIFLRRCCQLSTTSSAPTACLPLDVGAQHMVEGRWEGGTKSSYLQRAL